MEGEPIFGEDKAQIKSYDMTLHRIFEEQVKKFPNRIALVYDSQRISYKDLDDKANRLASLLRRMGARPGVFVGISVERSAELIIGILGILKSGAAYVPLDPDYPKDRLSIIIKDCQASILLTQKSLLTQDFNTDAKVITLDELWDIELDDGNFTVTYNEIGKAEDIAYVIYTSGSTGVPKGVLTAHKNVTRLFKVSQSLYGFTERDVWTLFHSYAFDFSVWEIWGPLLHGGTLVVVPYCISRSPQEFYKLLKQEKVTVLNQTPSAFFQFMREDKGGLNLRYVILGGEALDFKALQPWIDRYGFNKPQLVNGYGPTETTIFATFKFIEPADISANISNIGLALPDLQMSLVDANLKPVEEGEPGEILIAGEGVSSGYLNRLELTAEKFVCIPTEKGNAIAYRTGDLARLLPNKCLEYLGRLDQQVKIRGFRIELGEIEAVLRQISSVIDAAVIVKQDLLNNGVPGEKFLVAFVILKEDTSIQMQAIREYLYSKLPDYLVPQVITNIKEFPLSPHGKLDREALKNRELSQQTRPELEQTFIEPVTTTERLLAQLWCSLLKLEKVGVQDPFFDLGGSSLLVNEMVTRLKFEYGIDIPVVKVFEHPTIFALASLIDGKKNREVEESDFHSHCNSTDVAIIGMAGKFPGSSSIPEFWRNLAEAKETTRFFQKEELDSSVSEELKNHPSYVAARGVIDGIEYFDSEFFGIPPLEATVMDPQHRLFLETAYEALENAGYGPDSWAISRRGTVGVFAGTYNNSYYKTHVLARPDLIARVGEFQTMVANEKDYVATRTSAKLNLTGPSVSLYTACSTSLVAACKAYYALITGQCSLAVAGGASITVPQKQGHLYQEGSMLSKDGHTCTFDEDAQGTVFSDGVGAVILKRLDDALADGDTIYAVIKGAAVNNDGSNRVSFTAPSVEGQAAVIRAALSRSGVNPDSISYVETHGTATPLGDPIEIEALTQAFRAWTRNKQFCAVGSIKSNFGHTTIAAGVAGLMKTALALKNEILPASLNFKKENSKINFKESPFWVNSTTRPWPKSSQMRRAGVSSFGVGGTNAHIILEEAPKEQKVSSSRPYQMIALSAKTSGALERLTEKFTDWLRKNPQVNLGDVAFTLQTGRKAHSYRKFVILEKGSVPKGESDWTQSKNQKNSLDVIFSFPSSSASNDSTNLKIEIELYQNEPAYKNAIDECVSLIGESVFKNPGPFVLSYALAKLWLSWGIKPKYMRGEGIGSSVKACIAGELTLKEAIQNNGSYILDNYKNKENESNAIILEINPHSNLKTLLNSLGHLWLSGVEINWDAFYSTEKRKRVPLPTYPFERKRYWADRPMGEKKINMMQDEQKTQKKSLILNLKDILQDVSGMDLTSMDDVTTFFEVGMDSLLLTQVATELNRKFNVKVTFRQLLEEMTNLDQLAEFLSKASSTSQTQNVAPKISARVQSEVLPEVQRKVEEQKNEEVKPFGAQARINLNKGESLNSQQRERLESLFKSYCQKTQKSKEMAQCFRKQLADPRVVSGFRPILKEIIYPIHTERSFGARLWDVDGNEYIDMTCGFGTNFFGYVPTFVQEAIKSQVEKGMEIGPSHPLAGQVAKLFCEMTGAERVAFCSTGSEAVLGCMRLARTITGKKIIVSFTGDYHGIFDEVIVRGNKALRTMPAAPGITPESVQNILILDYGTSEALEIIKSRAQDIAGVLVEPVQSRNPDLQPKEFLKELRKLTTEENIALIFDEVITGFRVAPGGAQEYFGVKADLASYGKVIGGGLPMGVIAGKKDWMDGLDGGAWQFGDDSAPTVGITYFAGTYVRHPLALATAHAVLKELQRRPNLQNELNSRTTAMVRELNSHFKRVGAPIHVMHFSSMMKVTYTQELAYGELLYTLMREKGIHIWDQRPIFLTAAHTQADIQKVIQVFKESVADLQAVGFIPGSSVGQTQETAFKPGLTLGPPVAGARLGRDRQGNPAWFVADPTFPGRYLQIDV